MSVKKLVALILAAMLCLSGAIVAMADDAKLVFSMSHPMVTA